MGRKAKEEMRTCEFCQYGGDECYLLEEPIEYESSGMTIKENCPIRHDKIPISHDGWKACRSEDKSH